MKVFLMMVIFLGMAFVSPAFSADYYLDPANGNDSNNGNIATPWKTMNKVIVSLSPGDTVYIKGGTYTESQYYAEGTGNILSWTQADSLGTANNPITIQASPGEKVIFDGGISNYFLDFSAENNTYQGHYVIIKDLMFKNYRTPVLRVSRGAKNILIDNCSFTGIYDSSSGAIKIGNEGKYTIVRNSYIADIGDASISYNENPDHGFYISEGSENILIDNNVIKNTYGQGLQAYGHGDYTKTTKNLIIRKNQVINPQRTAQKISATNYEGVYIYNNTFYGEKGSYAPTYAPSGPADGVAFLSIVNPTFNKVKIKNNIGYGYVSTSAVEWDNSVVGAGFSNSLLNYNLWHNLNKPSRIYYWASIYYDLPGFKTATGYELNSIVGNPLFVDPANYNLAIQSGSPAIDAGTFLTTTVGSGTGTNITVEDAGYFVDGYDMIEGDTIQIGSNIVKVTDVNYTTNVIIIDRAISWSNGEGISLPYSGAKPDMGAYEYAAASIDTTPPLPPTGLVVK